MNFILTIRDIAIAIGFDVDKNSVSAVENSINKVKGFAKKALGILGIGLTISGITGLAETAAEAEALKSQFAQVFGDVEKNAQEKLNAISKDTGVAVNRMKASFTQIAAFSKTTGASSAEALNISERAIVAVADSAAFYDRSIEEVTSSMQSFLKGNYANDAALGLSCTETTRNTAANALFSKSFKDLSESQKQLTLLKMVEDANKTSGALGQAARESDTWGNRLGNLMQSIKKLKETAGRTILKPAIQGLKIATSFVNKLTRGIKELAKEGGFLERTGERFHSLIKRIQPAVERVMNTLRKGANISVGAISSIIHKVGGVENALKILAVIAGAFIIALNFSKIVNGIKMMGTLFSGFGKILNPVALKVLAIAAVIIILFLIVEDFINFMKGNDSVIGKLFEKAGIDANKVRETITNAWKAVVSFLKSAWEFLSEIGGRVFGFLKDTIGNSNSEIRQKISAVWDAIVKLLTVVFQKIYDIGAELFTTFSRLISGIFDAVSAFWHSWGNDIINWFSVLWTALGDEILAFLDIVTGVINFISSVLSGDWKGAWEAIGQIFSGVWDFITAFLTGAWETVKLLFSMGLSAIKAIWEGIWNAIKSFFVNIWNGISSFVSGIWNGMVSGVSTFVGNIKTTIVNGFTDAINWIKGLPGEAVKWGSDMIDGIVDGIKGAIGKVGDAVKGVADKIKSFLHFSVPDEGPLTDYESWMPDFMSGLASGIKNNKKVLIDKVKDVAGSMAVLMKASTAMPGTAARTTSGNRTSSIVQNVNIDNSYSGGSMETQKNVSRAMKKSSEDATSEMAKALAYSRG